MMDVKKAIEDVRESKTLRQVLGSLLAIGNFLNGREVRRWVGKTTGGVVRVCACACVCGGGGGKAAGGEAWVSLVE